MLPGKKLHHIVTHYQARDIVQTIQVHLFTAG